MDHLRSDAIGLLHWRVKCNSIYNCREYGLCLPSVGGPTFVSLTGPPSADSMASCGAATTLTALPLHLKVLLLCPMRWLIMPRAISTPLAAINLLCKVTASDYNSVPTKRPADILFDPQTILIQEDTDTDRAAKLCLGGGCTRTASCPFLHTSHQ